MLNLIIKH